MDIYKIHKNNSISRNGEILKYTIGAKWTNIFQKKIILVKKNGLVTLYRNDFPISYATNAEDAWVDDGIIWVKNANAIKPFENDILLEESIIKLDAQGNHQKKSLKEIPNEQSN